MAVVRFLSKIILQLFELPLVLRQDERILIDRGDLLVDSGEGFFRARLLLAQFADELGAIRQPSQLAGDSRDPLLQTSLVPEGIERRLPIDVGPKRRNLVMQFVDAVLDPVAAIWPCSRTSVTRASNDLRRVVRSSRADDDRTHRSCFVSRIFISFEPSSNSVCSFATRAPRSFRSWSKPTSCVCNPGRRPSASSRAAISASFAWMSPFTVVNRSFALSRACSKISNRKSFWNTARRSEPLAAPSSFISSCRTKVEFRNPS